MAGWIVGLSYVAKRESTTGRLQRWPLSALGLTLFLAALVNNRGVSPAGHRDRLRCRSVGCLVSPAHLRRRGAKSGTHRGRAPGRHLSGGLAGGDASALGGGRVPGMLRHGPAGTAVCAGHVTIPIPEIQVSKYQHAVPDPRQYHNLTLIGFMGAGKSTVASLAAGLLRFQVVDTDRVIEERAGRRISEIFELEGEAAFRAREAALVSELESVKDRVIATGGGLPMNPANLASLKRHSSVVCLWASPTPSISGCDPRDTARCCKRQTRWRASGNCWPSGHRCTGRRTCWWAWISGHPWRRRGPWSPDSGRRGV